MSLVISEQEQMRREALKELLHMGINPYPAESYEVTSNSKDILENFPNDNSLYQDISLAGRIMSRRIMGNASFVELQDDHGRIQLYFNRDEICPGDDKTSYNVVFKRLLDIGDIIGIKGFVFVTRMGEVTVHVKEYKILCKSLRPLPVVKEKDGELYNAFTDPEQRYRQRYIDLIVNPQIKDTFRKRAKLIQSMRDFLNNKGYLEVETPVLQPIYGGAAARPFKTYHNTLDTTLYLRIANELYLKRLIVGGFDGVFEFAKDFRNEGMSRFHNPEFTQMELYVAYQDYEWMMNMVEEMVEQIALDVNGTTKVEVGNHIIDFKRPWQRFSMYEAIAHFAGTDVSEMDEEALRAFATKKGIETDSIMGRGKLIDEIFGEFCEPNLIQPTFITDYPVEMSPLAKKHRSKPGLVERFEAICNGKEICNSFSELNDPIDQRERFEEQLELGRRGDPEAMMLDEDFLRAIETGMPPTAGLGVGVDRLAMIMTNSNSIQDVLFFPQMRPEKVSTVTSNTDGFEKIGVPPVWIPVLQQAGFAEPTALKNVNPNKVFNQICGLRKKLKMDAPAPKPEEVKLWIENAEK